MSKWTNLKLFNVDISGTHFDLKQKKPPFGRFLFFFKSKGYFTFSTIALNASGSFIAKSAKTLRLRPMWFVLSLPMS